MDSTIGRHGGSGHASSGGDSCESRYLDTLHREAGFYLRQSARLQKQLAVALDRDESVVSRMVNGDPNASRVVTAYYDVVKRLGRDEKTTAAFLIAGSMLEATNVAAEHFTIGELRARQRLAQDSEDRAQAREDVAEKQVARAEADLHHDPSPETYRAYSEALDAHRGATIDELSWSLEVQIVGRALRKRYAEGLEGVH